MAEKEDPKVRRERAREQTMMQDTYEVTSNRTVLEEGTLVRIIASDGDKFVVQFYTDGVRSEVGTGKTVAGLVPRVVSIPKTTFTNNTKKTDREYRRA